jgi:hypothetical protein
MIDYPQKRREIHNHHFDSTIWNDFAFRDDNNGRWRDILSAEESAAYLSRAVAELGADGARWLQTGERA